MTQPHALESICPSCGKTDKTLWPEGCNNQWHKEEWERLQQENAKLREALKKARPYLYETLDAPIDVRNKVSDALLEASK